MVTVLVVENDTGLRGAIAANLELDGGHTVIQAGNGIEALAKYRSADPKPDIVITDRGMPGQGGDGITLIRNLRAEDPQLPIIMHAGDALSLIRENADLHPQATDPLQNYEFVIKGSGWDHLMQAFDRMLAKVHEIQLAQQVNPAQLETTATTGPLGREAVIRENSATASPAISPSQQETYLSASAIEPRSPTTSPNPPTRQGGGPTHT